jgi:hypothetical protein
MLYSGHLLPYWNSCVLQCSRIWGPIRFTEYVLQNYKNKILLKAETCCLLKYGIKHVVLDFSLYVQLFYDLYY